MKNTFYLLLGVILLLSSCTSNEETLGQKSLNILTMIGNKDSISFFENSPTLTEEKRLAADTSLHLEYNEKILGFPEEVYDARCNKYFKKSIVKIEELEIDVANISYISEVNTQIEGSKRHPPRILVDVIFTDGRYNYEFRSEYTNVNNDVRFSRINKNSLNNISKIEYTYKENESNDKEITLYRDDNSSQNEFRTAVFESILTDIIPNSEFNMYPSGIKYNYPGVNYIVSADEVDFSLDIEKVRISGKIMGMDTIKRNGLVVLKLEVFNNNGIKLIEQIRDPEIYNDGSGMSSNHLRFDSYSMGETDLYELITVVLSVNDKVIFSRKDSWANFVFGRMSHEKVNGRYVFTLGGYRSNEVQVRNEKYRFKLSY